MRCNGFGSPTCAVPTMLIAAGIAFAGAGLCQWLVPETKGLSLTEAAAGLSGTREHGDAPGPTLGGGFGQGHAAG